MHTQSLAPTRRPQDLLSERARLREEVSSLKAKATADAEATSGMLEARQAALERQAGDLAALREALGRTEGELRAAQLELQLRSRQAAHEEGLTRDTLRQQEAGLVRGRRAPRLLS